MNKLCERLELCFAEYESANGYALTNTKFADACGVSKQSVGDWFIGRTVKMNGEVLLDAADFFKVSPRWLATGKGDRHLFADNMIAGSSSDLVGKLNLDAADFALIGILEYKKSYPLTMEDEVWRKRAFTTLYRAWFNEEMRSLGVIPLLNLVA